MFPGSSSTLYAASDTEMQVSTCYMRQLTSYVRGSRSKDTNFGGNLKFSVNCISSAQRGILRGCSWPKALQLQAVILMEAVQDMEGTSYNAEKFYCC